MEEPGTQRLTNDDFRKLLMTPRAPPTGAGSVREAMSNSGSSKSSSSERHEARRKKKNFYANLKRQEDNKLAELSEKYRDRARERRDGANADYQPSDSASSSNAYRAVAPDLKSGMDAAERRKQMIQESKFLGGDMEHTHLVKGLDYALLQKVRSEIVVKEHEEEMEMERLAEEKDEEEEEEVPEEDSEELKFKTLMGRNVFNIVNAYRSKKIERNELFAPGRMAYVIDMDEENAETDIPTTLIRSKADLPPEAREVQTLSTNDIVINKLSQILSYLRQGGKGKKNKKRDKDKPLFKEPELPSSGGRGGEKGRGESSRSSEVPKKPLGDSIYDDIGDYEPTSSSSSRGRSDRSGKEEKSSKYKYFDKNEDDQRDGGGIMTAPPPPKIQTHLMSRLQAEPEGYAECYPGLEEMNDAIDDSDDEVDYTKMDLGNKKGPIGRWDFDTQEEYSDYMSSKEALPKAAFQYGVKMQDGRKTRKNKTEKNEKAQLDREWQQIQNIIEKRKSKGGGGSDEPKTKSAKH